LIDRDCKTKNPELGKRGKIQRQIGRCRRQRVNRHRHCRLANPTEEAIDSRCQDAWFTGKVMHSTFASTKPKALLEEHYSTNEAQL
jgi:hypothetical protein